MSPDELQKPSPTTSEGEISSRAGPSHGRPHLASWERARGI